MTQQTQTANSNVAVRTDLALEGMVREVTDHVSQKGNKYGTAVLACENGVDKTVVFLGVASDPDVKAALDEVRAAMDACEMTVLRGGYERGEATRNFMVAGLARPSDASAPEPMERPAPQPKAEKPAHQAAPQPANDAKPAAQEPAAGTDAKDPLYALKGTISKVKRSTTKPQKGEGKPYASFRLAYTMGGKEQERTAMAFGKGLANIEHLLDAKGPVRLLGRFQTTKPTKDQKGGQSIVVLGVPQEKGQKRAA